MKTINELKAEWIAYYDAQGYDLDQRIECTMDEVAFAPSSPEPNHEAAARELLAELQASA